MYTYIVKLSVSVCVHVFLGEQFVCMKLHDCLLLLVSMRRCVIDKEDKQVYVYDTCSQCVCVMCVYEGA